MWQEIDNRLETYQRESIELKDENMTRMLVESLSCVNFCLAMKFSEVVSDNMEHLQVTTVKCDYDKDLIQTLLLLKLAPTNHIFVD